MNGEMFKDARLQERITDAVHAVEFDLEDVPSAPVGSLLSEGLRETGGFQRVADEEDATGMSAARRTMEEAHVRDFVDEIADESSRASAAFQRVSDEEEARGQTFSEEPTPPMPAKRESPSRRKKSGVISRFFKSKKSDDEEQGETSPEVSASEEVTKETVDTFPDSDASITTGRPHEELATRRGGRRRRRPPLKRPASGEANDSDNANDQDETSEVIDENEPIEIEAAANEDETVADAKPAVDGEEQTKSAPRQRRPPARGGRGRTTRH